MSLKKQKTIAQSSAELVSYGAASKATSQAIWLQGRILEDIREKQGTLL